MTNKKHSPLRIRRFLSGITLDELAFRTKIDQARLSRIENGWKKPTESERHRIARVLGVKEADIFPESENAIA